MKIGIVCFNLAWQAGGVRLIYSQARSLEAQGHSVVIYGPEFDPAIYPDLWKGLTINVVPPPKPLAWQYAHAGIFRRVIEKFAQQKAFRLAATAIANAMDDDFDVINLHDFAYSMAPLCKRRNPNAKIVWTMNDPPYGYLPKDSFLYDLGSRMFNWYREQTAKRDLSCVDSAVVLVERNKQWAEERGIPAKVIWSGITFDQFYAPTKSIAGKKTIKLLSVGALLKYRRFEDTLRAAQILIKKGFAIEVTIIAKNIYHEDTYRDELIALARDLGISKQTQFLFDGVSEDGLKKAYEESDFFVLPVHLPPPRNGFGWQLVIFEAMAAGVPSIVCTTNDVTEALRDGETAFFVPPIDPTTIAEKIESCLRDPARYDAVAHGGQQFVRENISWDTYAREFAEFAKANH